MTETGSGRPSLSTRHAMTTATALNAAFDAGLIAALDTEPITVEHLAGRTGTHPRGVRLVLDALAVERFVISGPDGYQWSDWPDVRHLEKLRYGTAQLLKTGTIDASVEEPGAAQIAYQNVVAKIAVYSSVAAGLVAADLRPGQRVLDVAAGAAPFGLAAARAGAAVTLLDLPDVVDVGAERVRAAGLEVSVVAADAFDESLDLQFNASFDAIIVGGFCRLFAGAQVEILLTRIAGWLAPSGRLFIADAVDSFEARQRGIGLYALSLATRTTGGGVHSFARYAQWLGRAGFDHLELTASDFVETSVISATITQRGE